MIYIGKHSYTLNMAQSHLEQGICQQHSPHDSRFKEQTLHSKKPVSCLYTTNKRNISFFVGSTKVYKTLSMVLILLAVTTRQQQKVTNPP